MKEGESPTKPRKGSGKHGPDQSASKHHETYIRICTWSKNNLYLCIMFITIANTLYFHFIWEAGKPGCYVAAAMMAWLWTDVCHTYNTLSLCIGGNAHCALCTVLSWKVLAKYATPSGHERRQHLGDYRSKKELKERGVGLSQWKKEERGEAGAGMA